MIKLSATYKINTLDSNIKVGWKKKGRKKSIPKERWSDYPNIRQNRLLNKNFH